MLMGTGGSGGGRDDDRDESEDRTEGVPPEQTTITDGYDQPESPEDEKTPPEEEEVSVKSPGGAVGGAVGGVSVPPNGEVGTGDTEEPLEPDQPEPDQPEPDQPEPEDSQDDSNEDDEFDEPQTAELIIRTDAWDVVGWGIEPVLKKLEVEFGPSLDISYRPLSPREFDSTVLDDAEERYSMPITSSSKRDSIPETTAQSTKALNLVYSNFPSYYREFLRELRIAAIAIGENIEEYEVLLEYLDKAGIDTEIFEQQWNAAVDSPLKDYQETPVMFGTAGDSKVDWSGNLNYSFGYGFLLDNDVLPLGIVPGISEFISMYGPVSTTEIGEVIGPLRPDTETELQETGFKKLHIEHGEFWDTI